MKHFKMIGLAALAALALIAIVGAASASATVLCKTTGKTTGCASSGWDWPNDTVIHAVLEEDTPVVLSSTWTTVICWTSTVQSKVNTGGSSSTVSGPIEVLTLETCTCSDSGTAHATVIAKGELEIHQNSGTDNGLVTGKNTVVTYNCTPLGTQCRFGSGSGIFTGEITGGHMATVHVFAEAVWSSGPNDEGTFICGTTAAWEASYTVTSPEPLFISTS